MQHKHSVDVHIPDLETKTKQIKKHFEQNKKIYLVGVGCFALGYTLHKPTTIIINNQIVT